MSKILVEFYWDCGRQGSLDGLFVTTPEALAGLYGKEVYFGEVLGKHSEIVGTIEVEDFTLKSDDPAFIDKLVEIIGSDTISGFNPFHYLNEDEDEEEGEEFDAEDE